MASKNYYEILGIKEHASQQEIKDAYRKMAHKYHPDKNAEDPDVEEFLNMMQAYNVLKDEEKRSSYDKGLKKQEANNPAPHFRDIYDEVYSNENPFDFHDDFVREIFDSFFKRSRSKESGPERGYNHRHYDDLLG